MFSADDFRKAILQLMPQGPAWSRAPDSLASLLAGAWASGFARNTMRAENLLIDAFPSSTIELLPEWEASLGLPDPCAGEGATLAQRRSQVVARISDNGGSSIAYFTAFAAALGYVIAVTEYAPSRSGIMKSGQALLNEDWAYCWLVTGPGVTEILARSGLFASGEALMTWSNGPLKCEIEARNPAHLILRFGVFSDDPAGR